jgi:hypothetical protein
MSFLIAKAITAGLGNEGHSGNDAKPVVHVTMTKATTLVMVNKLNIVTKVLAYITV